MHITFLIPASQVAGETPTYDHHGIVTNTLKCFLETEYCLFPPVTKFLDLFPRAGYFFNASD